MNLALLILIFLIGAIAGAILAWLFSFRPKLQRITDTLYAEQKAKELLLIEQGKTAEKLEASNNLEAKLKDVFKALSAEALNSNNEAFINLAKSQLEKYQEGARHDLELRQKSIDALVKPITEGLASVDKKVQELDKARIETYATLNEQVKNLISVQTSLQGETNNLVNALRTPKVRGRWGEMLLRQVVEMAGMLEHCHFSEQSSLQTSEGLLRPDLTVHLPGNKDIVVDSKVPLDAYMNAMEAIDNEPARLDYLKKHARQVRAHISDLSSKNYWKQFNNSPEFVVLFLPGESFYSAALEQDPELIEVGWRERVLIATPTTLIALLNAVAYGWTSEALTKNAAAISDLGRELYARLRIFTDHFVQVGRGIAGTIKAYNDAVGSWENRVLVTARKFNELSVSDGEEIKIVEPIEILPRAISSIELNING